jgi:hypothetical protein
MPPLNQFDAAAALPLDMLTGVPDLRPYAAKPVDRRLFDPEMAFKPFDRRFNWRQLAESVEMDAPEDMRRAFDEPDDALARVVGARIGK